MEETHVLFEKKHILVVEDDAGIRSFIKAELKHEGFSVAEATTGREALASFEEAEPDMILLDIMLPELSGLEVLRRIRKTSAVPVILVTARGETYDKVNGLDAGADDYIAKPFEIEELLARMRSLFRRNEMAVACAAEAVHKTQNDDVLRIRSLVITMSTMEVTLDGSRVTLSRTEYLLLKYFIEHRNVVLSREQIINDVWGSEHYIDENAVDVYVGYLRSKIDKAAGEEYISTVRGTGYMMKDDRDVLTDGV